MPRTSSRIVWRAPARALSRLSETARLPRLVALAVVVVAVAIAPGLPDSVAGAAARGSVGGRTTEAHRSTASPVHRAVAPAGELRVLAVAAGSMGSDPRPLLLEPSPAVTTGCSVGGAITMQLTGDDNRDERAMRAGTRTMTGCRLAGRKRVHQVGEGSAAAGDPPQVTPVTTGLVAAPGVRWTGAFNLYRKTAFVTQRDFKWCVAASVQMMVNIVRHKSDRTMATQERMIAYAQASDHGPWGPGGGTDVTGWIAALRHFGAGRYRAVGVRTPAAALRIAATAIRQTGRPAGMLVMDGRHAWILHGFESRTDPRRDRRAKITSVRVSGPLYPIQRKNGYDLRPNTELSVRALEKYFQPSSVGTLVGKYVVIVPVH